MSNHLPHLRALMRERHIAACLITGAANRRYISGFRGSSGALLVTDEYAILFTDARYRLRVGLEAPLFELREFSAVTPLFQVFAATVIELGLRQVAFEAAQISFAGHAALVRAFKEQASSERNMPELLPTEGLVESLREVKDASELAVLCHAIELTDTAIEAVIPQLSPDLTEKQVAWLLEAEMRKCGADGLAFPIIVAAGPNGASPHALPGDNRLGTGRPIIIDMGAVLDGYHADLTRTIILGDPDERFREVYQTVLAAQQHAIANLRAGLTCDEADALAREVISAAGFGDNFGHGLGHGVGLEIHEGPSLRRKPACKDAEMPSLRVGNIVSVEPGIYLEGWGGVRIEDLVMIHEDGCEVLSQASKLL
ncbi:MAG: aminopeptidase P family protein [Chloroflexales bacterium]|nr:aminopeptidase P family protein [Chloroflexales bacterium]